MLHALTLCLASCIFLTSAMGEQTSQSPFADAAWLECAKTPARKSIFLDKARQIAGAMKEEARVLALARIANEQAKTNLIEDAEATAQEARKQQVGPLRRPL
jgi:hypothetical protein